MKQKTNRRNEAQNSKGCGSMLWAFRWCGVMSLCCALTVLVWSQQVQQQVPGGSVVELRGSAGDSMQVIVPIMCVEYEKPAPEWHTTLSVYPKLVQEQALRVLQLGRTLQEDPQARFLALLRSPIYADVLRNYALMMWLIESEVVEEELKKAPYLQQRLDAYRQLGRILISEEALTRAVQRAVWTITSDITLQRLRDDGRAASKTPQDKVVVELDILFLSPYVQILLSEAGIERKWAFPEGGWVPPVEDEVSYPALEVLLNYTPLSNLLKAADDCFRTGRWASAAFYYRHALSRPHPEALTPYLCLRLACAYDRLCQQETTPSLEKHRKQAQEVLSRINIANGASLEDENAPELSNLPADGVEQHLHQAESALCRAQYIITTRRPSAVGGI